MLFKISISFTLCIDESLRGNKLKEKQASQAFVALIDYELQAKGHYRYISFIHKGYTMIANRQ